MQNGVKKLYFKIQKDLISLVPENWESILLYASVINGAKGEMYFYYYPKKIIKAKPINCYEIPNKFGVDDTKYYKRLKKLYERIKELNTYSFPKWTNITITIKNNIFTVECKYNDLLKSRYTDEERRILWGFKYLNTPIESMSLREKILIQTFNEESEIKPTVYSEFLDAGATEREKAENNEYEKQNDFTPEEDQKVRNRILKY